MKIGMISRSTLYETPGGDTMQIEMTAKYLRKIGVEVDIYTSDRKVLYSNYDLLHFFNIIRPDDILPHIRRTNVQFVLSTIFVDYLEFEKKKRSGIFRTMSKILNRNQLEFSKALVRWIKNGDCIRSNFYLLKGHKASVKYIVSRAALLLPNSDNEYKRFVEIYKVHPNYRKIVNAIDSEIFCDSAGINSKYTGHVLCVGRVEALKNQLNLIRALIHTDLHLTIVGKPSPNHKKYYEECISLGSKSKNVHFVNHVTHNELAGMYKAAKVHVLPSWFETTGLSSLEAGVMDCNVVITRKGDTEEYFRDMAYYCDPDSVESIRVAVLKAFTEPLNPKLKSFIENNYTWKSAADQTLKAYQSVIELDN